MEDGVRIEEEPWRMGKGKYLRWCGGEVWKEGDGECKENGNLMDISLALEGFSTHNGTACFFVCFVGGSLNLA